MSENSDKTLIWTIGSGGLIGSAINAVSESAFAAIRINWRESPRSILDLDENLNSFFKEATHYQSWAIIWAAGAATTATTQSDADNELELFTLFLSLLASKQPTTTPGSFVLISSAGAIYAGAKNPPFTEETPPQPIGVYGHLKLAQEQATQTALNPTSIHTTIARVSNAYGPGQDFNKLQGLISRLALSTLKREPINLFVPLSTVRDFIYTGDLAKLVHALVKRNHDPLDSLSRSEIKILASGFGTSIGQLIKICQNVFHRRIPIAMGTHPSAQFQAPLLTFDPATNLGTEGFTHTSLPIGVKMVYDDMLTRHANLEPTFFTAGG